MAGISSTSPSPGPAARRRSLRRSGLVRSTRRIRRSRFLRPSRGVLRLRPSVVRPRAPPDGAVLRSRPASTAGDPFPLADHVSQKAAAIWVPRLRRTAPWCSASTTHEQPTQLTWFDRAGGALGTLSDSALYIGPRAFTRRPARCGRPGNGPAGKPRHLDHRFGTVASVPPDLRPGNRFVARLVARRHAHRVLGLAIREASPCVSNWSTERPPINHSSKSRAISRSSSEWLVRGWAFHRVYARNVAAASTSGFFRCSAIANRFRWHEPRSSRRSGVLSGRTLDRVPEQRRWPGQH